MKIRQRPDDLFLLRAGKVVRTGKESKMNCPRCGKRNKSLARYCLECGEALSPGAGELEPDHGPEGSPAAGKPARIFLAALALILFSILGKEMYDFVLSPFWEEFHEAMTRAQPNPEQIRIRRNQISNLKQKTDQSPGDADAWKALGLAYARSGMHDQAIQAFQKAVALNPSFAMAWNDLCAEYHEADRPLDALTACKKAISLQQGFAMAWNNLGNAYFDLALRSTGEQRQLYRTKAIAAYEKSLQFSPGYPDPQRNLRLLRQTLGE